MQFFAGSETALGIEQAFQKAYRKMKRYVQTTAVLPSRQIIAGDGLTGGGNLSADRTFNVVANVDGSIVVNPDNIRVGVLASDTQHGNRGGGALHSVSSAIANGFMSASDKSKLDALNVTNFNIVPDIASLKSINTTGYVDGTIIYMTAFRDFYSLDTINTYTPDDLVVIKPTTGPGYWIAYTEGRWDDLLGDISQGTGAASLTYENFWDTQYKQYFFRENQNDSLSMRFQMSHTWRRDSVIYPHLHCILCADPLADQDMYFSGHYYWTPIGSKTPSLASWGTFAFTYTVSPGDIYDNVYIPLFNTAPMVTNTWESSILKIFVQREGTNILDTYNTAKPWGTAAANLGLDSFDVHYIKDKQGTLNQIPTAIGGT